MSGKVDDSFSKKLDVTMESQKSSGKVFSLTDVEKHNESGDLWLAIHNKVYNITKFLDEHPGGVEVLLENAGTDATFAFEDVGHSLDARDLLAQYYIGDLHEDDQVKKAVTSDTTLEESSGMSNGLIIAAIVGVAACAAFFLYSNRL